MRGFLTYLMLIVFIGSHWLADLTPHFHGETENTATIESSIYNAERGEGMEIVSAETIASSIFDDCCAIEDQINAASDIYCMADCGLIASNYQPYRPSSRYNVALPADIPTASIVVSNPFRPPIV